MSPKKISVSMNKSTKSKSGKGRVTRMTTTTGANKPASADKLLVSWRKTMAPYALIILSVGWDALASTILNQNPDLGNWVKLIIYAPTGALFLWSIELGLGVGASYILFGVLVAVANGLAGLALGQVPQNAILAIAGATLGLYAVFLSSKIRSAEDSVLNKKWVVVVLSAATLTALLLFSNQSYQTMGMLILAAAATALWDLSATPISQKAEQALAAKANFWTKTATRLVSFIPTSWMYALVLEQNKNLLEAAMFVGIFSAAIAPLMEALIYDSEQPKDFRLLPWVVVLGATSIWMLKTAF